MNLCVITEVMVNEDGSPLTLIVASRWLSEEFDSTVKSGMTNFAQGLYEFEIHVDADKVDDFRRAMSEKKLSEIDPIEYCPGLFQALSVMKLKSL